MFKMGYLIWLAYGKHNSASNKMKKKHYTGDPGFDQLMAFASGEQHWLFLSKQNKRLQFCLNLPSKKKKKKHVLHMCLAEMQ